MRYPRLLLVVGALCATPVALGAGSMGAVDRAVQATTRTIYATVLDAEGTPVIDMAAGDFEVKDGNQVVEISDLRLAAVPVRVAILVADRGTGTFQAGVLRFCEAILAYGEISITGIIQQPQRLTDYSSSVDSVRAGLLQIGRRGTSQPGAQVVEAILDTAREIARPGFRPAIVVMRAGGEAPTPIRAEAVREELRDSGAVLYAVSTTGTQSVGGGGAPMTAGAMSQAGGMAELAEGALTLATILGDGARDSGGRHEQNISTTVVPAMQQIARELINQYQITYTLPAGTEPSDRVTVTSKREGLTVLAPSRLGV